MAVSQNWRLGAVLIQGIRSIKQGRAFVIENAAIPFCGTPFSLILRALWLNGFVAPLWYGRQIFEKRLGLAGGAAPCSQCLYTHDPDFLGLRKGQHVIDAHGVCGFGHPIAVNPHMSGADNFGSERSCLEEPPMPKPFIKSDFLFFIRILQGEP